MRTESANSPKDTMADRLPTVITSKSPGISCTDTICALCAKQETLKESHILPAFTARWAKKQWPTTSFINKELKDVQDLPKIPLLCGNCEQKLGKFEDAVARRMFRAVNDRAASKVEYGPWLLSFCYALAWRILVFGLRHPRFVEDERAVGPKSLERALSKLLLRPEEVTERPSCYVNIVDVEILDKYVRINPGTAAYGFYSSLLLGAEMNVVFDSKFASGYMVLARIPGFIFKMEPAKPYFSDGTRIEDNGTISVGESVDMRLLSFLRSRINSASVQRYLAMSEQRKQALKRQVLGWETRTPDRTKTIIDRDNRLHAGLNPTLAAALEFFEAARLGSQSSPHLVRGPSAPEL